MRTRQPYINSNSVNEQHAQVASEGSIHPTNAQMEIIRSKGAAEESTRRNGCGAEDGAPSASSQPPADSPISRMALDRAGVIRQLQDMPMTRACTRAVDDYSVCNAFVSEALSHVYGIDDFKQNKASRTFPDHLANDIANYVNTHSQWSRLGSAGDQRTLDEAQRARERRLRGHCSPR